jgi:hypothetical protein
MHKNRYKRGHSICRCDTCRIEKGDLKGKREREKRGKI